MENLKNISKSINNVLHLKKNWAFAKKYKKSSENLNI